MNLFHNAGRSSLCRTCRRGSGTLSVSTIRVADIFGRHDGGGECCTSSQGQLRSRSVLRSEILKQPGWAQYRVSTLSTVATTGDVSTDAAAAAAAAAEAKLLAARETELQRRIVEICDDTVIPYGEFSTELWNESLEVLKEMSSHHTALGLECSCMLMERLVIEQDAHKAAASMASNNSQSSFSSLTTNHLNDVVRNWEACWKNRLVTVTPPQMLSLIDDWVFRLEHDLHPDVETYTSLISGALFARINPPASRAFAENLFKRMVGEDDMHRHPNVRPNTATFEVMIHILAKQYADIPRAEFYLNQMFLEMARRDNHNVEPSIRSFTSIMRAYSNVEDDPNNVIPERAHAMLRRMQYLDTVGTLANVKPDEKVFALVLKCWAKSKHPLAAARLKELYAEMRADPIARPTSSFPLSQVLMKLAEEGDADAAKALLDEHLQDLTSPLDGPESNNNNNNNVPRPDHKCFEYVMRAWEKSGRPEALKQIEQLIERMKELSASEIIPNAKVRKAHYNLYLKCLERSPGTVEERKEIVAKIEGIIKEMEDLAAAGDAYVRPDEYTYTILILAHATHGQDPYEAEAVLERMYQRHLVDGKGSGTQPNTRCFNICLKAWAQSHADNAPERADGILRRMWKLHETGVLENVKPDTISYTTVMMCHLRSQSPDRGERCQLLLEDMEARSVPSGAPCYSVPMYTWLSLGEVAKAEECLDHFIKQYQIGKINFKPDTQAFNSVVQAWAKSRQPTAAARVEGLINRMEDHYKSGLLKQPPTRSTYAELLKTHYFSGETWAGEQAERVLRKMESLAANIRERLTEPTTDDYNVVLSAYAKEGRGMKAETLLGYMLDSYLSRRSQHAPNVASFNAVLSAWANAKDVNASGRLENILNQMDELHESGKLNVKPDTESLDVVLKCWTEGGQRVSPRNAESLLHRYASVASRQSWHIVIRSHAVLGNASQAERLMQQMYNSSEEQGKQMLKPNVATYNLVLQAISHSEDETKGEKGESLLREIQSLKDSTLRPNTVTYLMVMACYKKSNHPEVIQRVEALGEEVKRLADAGEGGIEFSTKIRHEMMSAYAWHGAPQKAEDILDELCLSVLEGYTASPKATTSLDVNARSMNIVLSAWAQVKNPERAEAILRKMRHYRDRGIPNMAPIAMNYIRVIECWNQSNDPTAGQRADSVLKLMEEDAQKNTKAHLYIANKGLYLTVMKRLAQSGSGECAESLLRRVQSLFDTEKSDTDVDQFLYREAILAWNTSASSEAAKRSKAIEQEMLEHFPNVAFKSHTIL